MRIEIELDGQRKLLDTIRKIDRELAKEIQAELRAGAVAIRRDARQMAPKGVTGNLRSGIRMRTWWPRWLSATVFVKAPHKYLVSHGRKPGKMPDVRDK